MNPPISVTKLNAPFCRARHGVRFTLSGVGFKVWGFGFRVTGFDFRVSGLGFRVWVEGLG